MDSGQPKRVAVVGHGRSPEGQGWGEKIDECDYVVRMWDWGWQDRRDYGEKYDIGLVELHESYMRQFNKHNRHHPADYWIGSKVDGARSVPVDSLVNTKIEVFDQTPWVELGENMGGVGVTGRLRYTRGALAALWVLENLHPKEIVLVGFDSVYKRYAEPLNEAFSSTYQKNPGTFSFAHYERTVAKNGTTTKHGNHDYNVERPVLEEIAHRNGVAVRFAQDLWGPTVTQKPSRRDNETWTALLLGDAKCVYDDAEAALELFEPEVIAACNNIGVKWQGHIDHWFTLHPHAAVDWAGIELAMKRRLEAGLNKPFTWGHKPAKGIDFDTPDWQGSTGLIAVKGLLEIGVQKIVLAGVPLTKQDGHFYDSKEWSQAERYRRGWNKRVDQLTPHVRSMSGWTREVFGAPTREWLEEK